MVNGWEVTTASIQSLLCVGGHSTLQPRLCHNPLMRFKAGLIIGFAIGFVVGARAGKERYDRLVAKVKGAMAHERVQQATDIAERSTRKTRAAAGSGLVSVADTVREKSAAN